MEAPLSTNVSEAPSTAATTAKLFQGCQVQIGEGESALSWQLSSGLTWRKKIWPRLAYPRSLHRWNTVEEILSYLMSFDSHEQWMTTEVPVKPLSGTILFFNRTKTKNYRSDGYDWKTRKSNASIREDRMKLKVCGMQDPDTIMVHYLEVEGEAMPAESLTANVDFDEAELRRSLTPANWAYLTISDKNISSILSQSNTALEIHTLTAQLRLTLDQNMTKVTTLDHAIATNNSGLPFDWVKEAQPKRQRARVAPKESGGICHEGGVGNARLINIGGVGSHAGAVSEQANENQILKALSSSPHIILCCPQNGSVSYVLLNSTSLSGGLGKGVGVVGDERGREGERNEANDPSSSGAPEFKEPRTAMPESRSLGKGQRGPKGNAAPLASQCDYDLTKFNNFASRLTELDPLQGFVSLETGGVPPEYYQAPTGGQNLEGGLKVNGSMLEDMSCVSMEQLMSSGSQFLPHSVKPLDKGSSNTAHTSQQDTHGTNTFNLTVASTTLPPPPSSSHPTPLSNSGGVLDGGNMEEGGEEMFDLSLNLDPESLRDLLKVPLSPELSLGRETEAGGQREETTTAMESSLTLSPISQLMQSLAPPTAVGREGEGEGEEVEGNGVLNGSLLSGVGHIGSNSSEMEMLAGSSTQNGASSETYIDIHSAQSGPLDSLHRNQQRLPRNPSLSSLPIFPEQSSPAGSSYQWEELLHRPSNSLTPSETTMTHSQHTTNPQSVTLPTTHTASHSGAPATLSSVPNPLYSSHPLSLLPNSSTMGLPFLSEVQQTSSFASQSSLNGCLSISQSRMGHSDHLYPSASAGSLPPISLPSPLDSTDPSVFSSGGSILGSLPEGGPSFLPPSSSHSPSFRPPPSPPQSTDSRDTPVTVMDNTCLLPSAQSSLSRSVSPRPLSNIPEGVPMSVLLEQHLAQQGVVGSFIDPSSAGLSLAPYRVPKSPTPSSPSIGSVSGHSTVSSLFDPGGESPSVLELCELLSESPNVQQHDFSNTTFTDTEQKQLYKAIQIIQNTFRKFKTQWQQLPRVEDRQKHAALLIENYYTRYRQLKQQQDRAARRIQHNYRKYRNRSREMNRAALFIQQMYRFHRIKRHQPLLEAHLSTTPVTTPNL